MRALLAIAGVTLLVAGFSSDAPDEFPTGGQTAPTSRPPGPSHSATALKSIVRIDQVPPVKRPDCATGRVVHIVPGTRAGRPFAEGRPVYFAIRAPTTLH